MKSRSQILQERYFLHLRLETEKQINKEITWLFREMFLDLFASFKEIEDYRARVDEYELNLLLVLLCIGILWAGNNVSAIEEILTLNIGKVRYYLGLSVAELPKVPSDTTLLECLAKVSWIQLLACVDEWLSKHISLSSKHIAVDGKAIRACLEKCFGGTHPPYILNAFDVENGVLRAQIAIDKKTNELGEMNNLFELLDLNGATVTIDAAGTNSEVVRAIVQSGGHCILPVKGNQKTLEEDLRLFFDEARLYNTEIIHEYDDEDNGKRKHGRVDSRKYFIITEGVEELLKDTTFEGLCHSVGMVIRERRIVRRDPVTNQLKMECSTQEVYYISDWDDRLSAQEFAGYVRDHWAGCEMIHYVLDTTFSEDLCRVRKGFSKQNYALLRRLIYAMLTWIKKTIHYTKGYAILRQSLRDTCGCIMINNNEGSCASECQYKAAS